MTTTRRSSEATFLPWLSGVLALACVAFSVHSLEQATEFASRAEADLAHARAYFVEYPYLEPGAALNHQVGPGEIDRLRREFEDRRRARHAPPIPPGVVRLQQQRLDERIAEAFVGWQDFDARRVAVDPDAGFSAAWFLHPLYHQSLWHLGGNLLLLLFFGLYLERSFGRVAYAAALLASAFGGAAAWSAGLAGATSQVLIGSSALGAGVLAAFVWRRRGEWQESFYAVGIVMGALWLVLPPWIGLRWSTAHLVPIGGGELLAADAVFWAMLGAVGGGGLVTLVVELLGIDGERIRDAQTEVTRHPLYRRAQRARRAGRPREALELLNEYVSEEPEAYEALLALADVAAELGRQDEATAARLRAIRIELSRGLTAAANERWLAIAEDGIPRQADPALLVRVAPLLHELGHIEEASLALRCALERSEDRASHALATRIAQAAHGVDDGVAEIAAWRALACFDLEFRQRQALERLLGEILGEGGIRATQPSLRAPEPRREASPAEGVDVTRAIEIGPAGRTLERVDARPIEIGDAGLTIQTDAGGKKLLRWERIDALALAAVAGLGAKPVLILDLSLNWLSSPGDPLRVIRLRADRFDPRTLVDAPSRVEALRSFVKQVLSLCAARALPDEQTVLGQPFASFDGLQDYERTILMVDPESGSSDQGRIE